MNIKKVSFVFVSLTIVLFLVGCESNDMRNQDCVKMADEQIDAKRDSYISAGFSEQQIQNNWQAVYDMCDAMSDVQ